MINEKYAKKYCCEDPSLIENYDLAIADTTQIWEIHHRRGTIYSRKDLKEIGEYYNRPAVELIFLTSSAHRQLHNKGIPKSESTKKALSKAHKGVPKSEEHKQAISDALTGVQLSEAHKQAISDALTGVQLSEAHKQAISDGMKGVPKGPMSEVHKQAISDALKGVNAKKVLQFTKSGEFVREWAYAYEAHRELGISQGNICACCNGKRKSAGGYMWRYAE